MPSYLIHDTWPCMVTAVKRVTAADPEDARDIALDEGGELLGVFLGDAVMMPGARGPEVLPDAPNNLPVPFYAEPSGQDRRLEAIRARLAGDWDNPALVAFGPLLPDTLDDIRRILAEEPTP